MIKGEVGFFEDNFSKPEIKGEKETIARIILNLLFLRPGNYPSQPHLGINIREYLYRTEDEVDIDELKNKLYMQCKELLPNIVSSDAKAFITTTEKGVDMLVILLPVVIDKTDDIILLGLTSNSNGDISYNYTFDSLRKQINN